MKKPASRFQCHALPGLRQAGSSCITNAAASCWDDQLLAVSQNRKPTVICGCCVVQAELRGEAGSAKSWDTLGATYERIGRLTASLKTCQRAVDLDPTRLYALTQVSLQCFCPGIANNECIVNVGATVRRNLCAEFWRYDVRRPHCLCIATLLWPALRLVQQTVLVSVVPGDDVVCPVYTASVVRVRNKCACKILSRPRAISSAFPTQVHTGSV
jgi:hypothetical protein